MPTARQRARQQQTAAADAQRPPNKAATRVKIAQNVPAGARAAWGFAFGTQCHKLIDAAAFARGDQASDAVDEALDGLIDCARRVLADHGSSGGRARRINGRATRVAHGERLTDDDDEDSAAADTHGGAHAASSARREHYARRRPGLSMPEEYYTAARVRRYLQLGNVSRGARAIDGLPMADCSDPAVRAKLAAKHPTAPPPPLIEDDAAALQIDAQVLRTVIRQWEAKRGTAPGLSGLTMEHVVAAARSSLDTFQAILAVVNLILSGELPRHPALLDAALIALTKPNQDVRPIAIGETLYKLAGTCALVSLSDKARELAPHQLGVGVSGGVEAAVHATLSALDEDPDAGLVKIDIDNAFNRADRGEIMRQVKEVVPCLLPFVRWAYGAASNLYVIGAPPSTEPLQSQVGVKQGDPLGTFLFALLLQPALLAAAAAVPAAPPAGDASAPPERPTAAAQEPPAAAAATPPAAATASDAAAPPAAQRAQPPAAPRERPPAAQRAQPPAAQRAQPPAAQRAEPPAAQRAQPPAAQRAQPPAAQRAEPPMAADAASRVAAVLAIADDTTFVGRVSALRTAFKTVEAECIDSNRGLHFQHGKCVGACGPEAEMAALCEELGVSHKPEGTVLCGTPIGTDAYIREQLAARADKVIQEIDKLLMLPLSAQEKWRLLQSSLAVRMTHLMRTVPWELLRDSMQRVESKVAAAAADILRLPTQPDADGLLLPCNAEDIEQLHAPQRHGGFGLRVATEAEANAAFLSGAAKGEAAMAKGPAQCRPLSGSRRDALLARWQPLFDEFAAECEWPPEARDLPADFVRDVLPGVQHAVGRAVGDRRGKAMIAAAQNRNDDVGKRRAARLLSAAGSAASAWLNCCPTAQKQLSDSAFTTNARFRLGYGPASSAASPPCLCSAGEAAYPDHAMVCTHVAGDRTLRHDTYYSSWRRVLRNAGCSTSAEQPYAGLVGDARAAARAGLHRADITAIVNMEVYAFDAVVTHPAAATHLAAASKTRGAAARTAARRKRRQFQETNPGAGIKFVPLSVETFGQLDVEASKFLSSLGAKVGERGGSQSQFMRNARSDLSCALVRGQERVFSAGMNAILRAGGKQFECGHAVPVCDGAE